MELALSFDSIIPSENDKKLELCAILDADSFFYGLWDQDQELCRVEYEERIPDFSKIDGLNVVKNRFGLVHGMFALIPESAFSPKEMELYVLHGCHIDQPEQYIFRNDYSEQFNLRVVYAIRRSDVKLLNDHFDSPSLVHFVTAFLDTLRPLTFDPKLHVLVHKTKMFIALTIGERLVLLNLFSIPSPVDMLYFISLVCNRFDLDPSNVQVELSGMIERDNSYHQTLAKYFGNLAFRNISFTGPHGNGHLYHSIYSVLKCA